METQIIKDGFTFKFMTDDFGHSVMTIKKDGQPTYSKMLGNMEGEEITDIYLNFQFEAMRVNYVKALDDIKK